MLGTWTQFLGWEDHLEKGMTTHSNILAWKIPWTEEPGCPKGHKELNTTEQPSTQCGLNAINQHCMLQRNHS